MQILIDGRAYQAVEVDLAAYPNTRALWRREWQVTGARGASGLLMEAADAPGLFRLILIARGSRAPRFIDTRRVDFTARGALA